MDVHVLVVYLEFLALEIIIAYQMQESRSVNNASHLLLNGLVLPQSWISRATRGPLRTAARTPLEGLFRVTEPLINRLLKWDGTGRLESIKLL